VAIDASIPLQSGIAQAPDPLTQYAKFVGVQQAVNQGRLADLQIRSLSTQLDRDAAIRANLAKLGPNASAADVAGVYMTGGDAPTAVKLQQGAADLDLKKAQLSGEQLKNLGLANEQVGQLLSGVKDQPSYEAAVKTAINSGNPQVAQMATEFYKANPQYNPDAVGAAVQRSLKVKDWLDYKTKQVGVTVPLPQSVADQKAAIKAAGRNPGGTPYFQAVPIMLPNGQPGLGRFNARTGQMEPISLPDEGGAQAPTMKTGDNTQLQGSLAESKSRGSTIGKAEGTNVAAEPGRQRDRQQLLQNIDEFSTMAGLDNIYGTVAGATPDVMPESVDARAKAQQIVSMLSLANRQKLQGQGAISDFESKLLANAATVLSNPRISAGRVREELKKIKQQLQNPPDRIGVTPGTPGTPEMVPHFGEPNNAALGAAGPATHVYIPGRGVVPVGQQ